MTYAHSELGLETVTGGKGCVERVLGDEKEVRLGEGTTRRRCE